MSLCVAHAHVLMGRRGLEADAQTETRKGLAGQSPRDKRETEALLGDLSRSRESGKEGPAFAGGWCGVAWWGRGGSKAQGDGPGGQGRIPGFSHCWAPRPP